MALAPGTRLGPYEITGTLGAGGMGEVYRATDTNLGRSVAIKVLPDAFAHDADRLLRFEREAKTLASLNHPNIAQIYGLEKAAGIPALVMELVEGPTLAERISRGPIDLDEAIAIARQIADALEAAHEQGIVHRDLKPANIKLRPDGALKVLDFGLAKALDPASATSVDATASPTITSPALMTGVGVLLGTAAYMSPEQARGRVVDKRSDIWAFGCVLYEMVTGRRAFDGEDVAETLAAVLKQPPPWDDIPPGVQTLLKSCLEKDPKRRLRDIGDAWRLLEHPSDARPVTVVSQSTPRVRWLWPGLVVLFALATLVLAFLQFRGTLPPQPVYQYTVSPPANSVVDSFAVSPDGRALVMATTIGGQRSLWLRALDSLEMRELPGTEDAQFPFWSPDSRFIGFVAQSKLKRIAADGGPAQSLADAGNFAGTWNRDGIIVFNGPGGLTSIAAAGGGPVRLLEKPAEAPLLHPAFVADGKQLLFSITQGTDDRRGVYVMTVGSQDARRLLIDASNAAFAPPDSGSRTGHLLFVRDGTLMAQPVDPASLQTAGEMFPVAEQILSPGVTSRHAYSVSDNGILVYQSGQSVSADRRLSWFDREGKELGVAGQPGRILNFALAPDERQVALARQGPRASHWDLWIAELVRGTEVRFTSDASINRNPVWAPDSGRIVFSSSRAGRTDLYEKGLDGTDPETPILQSNSPKNASDWSRDGRLVVYEDFGRGAQGRPHRDVFALPITGGRMPVPVLQSEFNEHQAQLSWDGRWLAYVSDESGREEIYVLPFTTNSAVPAGTAIRKHCVSSEGGIQPRWRGDGRELFFVGGNRIMSAAVTTTAGGVEVGVPRALFEIAPLASPLMAPSFRYAVTADGKRFLVLMDPQNAAAPPLTVVVNWQAALKQ